MPDHPRPLDPPELRTPVAVSPTIFLLVFPMLHPGKGGQHLPGGEARGQKFSQEDEDTLALFVA